MAENGRVLKSEYGASDKCPFWTLVGWAFSALFPAHFPTSLAPATTLDGPVVGELESF